ncbi:class I SAM-dependent methyltransferase [Ornithinicoccus hortensis]|uniref:Methyltransferase family protein n=1 Tax=Ornithinicoccus hortensis TaxID=82346 RepID=A0A542YQQ3_9MICO|nr:class I SAM-dependent methyltransferase [Ornithinicoccus hortensis]TQL50435.1 methyltransferase family protein [Ornithinicoccus hortensis]
MDGNDVVAGVDGPAEGQGQHPWEQALVRQGWELVEVMERLGPARTGTVFAPRWERSTERGASAYTPLPPTEGLSAFQRAMYESPGNLTRFAWTCALVRPGERVMEIGIGRGFLATMLLRDAGIGGYRGIELEAGNVRAANAMFAANGFADRATAEQGDLYQLTREVVADHGTDLLVCCEVLEHVPDPEAGLKALADALPEGTDLLVSVPLRGRLETIWGHVAMFGAARVRDMLAAAGLTVHHVEPLANTWVFVLASRDPRGSGRSALAAAAVPDLVADLEAPPEWPMRVDNVDVEPVESRWNRRLTSHRVRPADPERNERGAYLEATAEADPALAANLGRLGRGPLRRVPALRGAKGHYAGMQFRCTGVRGVRFELDPLDIDGVVAFYADFYAGGTRVARWKWDMTKRPKSKHPTFMLEERRSGTYFRKAQVGDVSTADAFELHAQVEQGATVRFGVRRLGWLR